MGQEVGEARQLFLSLTLILSLPLSLSLSLTPSLTPSLTDSLTHCLTVCLSLSHTFFAQHDNSKILLPARHQLFRAPSFFGDWGFVLGLVF